MQFQLASDIHIEKLYPSMCSILDFITPSCPNLILAGDIGSIYQADNLTHFFKTCKENFETIIYVPGNNEYYSRDNFTVKTMSELDEDLKDICVSTGILLLNNAYIETEDCIIFGSTWWSFIPDLLNVRIYTEPGVKMLSDDFNYLHSVARKSLNWILANKQGKKVLVVSHYCPTKLGTMNGHHRKDDFVELIPYYFSSSEKYLKKDVIDTWIFGHTHVFRDFLFNNNETRIISNADPRKKFFRKNYVFDFPNIHTMSISPLISL
jgi:predicted phosphodiesterase